MPPCCHVLVHACLFTCGPKATTWRNGLTCFCTCWVLSLLPDGAGVPIHAHSTPAIGHSLILHVPPMSHNFCILALTLLFAYLLCPAQAPGGVSTRVPYQLHNVEVQAFLFAPLLYPRATMCHLSTLVYTPVVSQSQDPAASARQVTYMQCRSVIM